MEPSYVDHAVLNNLYTDIFPLSQYVSDRAGREVELVVPTDTPNYKELVAGTIVAFNGARLNSPRIPVILPPMVSQTEVRVALLFALLL